MNSSILYAWLTASVKGSPLSSSLLSLVSLITSVIGISGALSTLIYLFLIIYSAFGSASLAALFIMLSLLFASLAAFSSALALAAAWALVVTANFNGNLFTRRRSPRSQVLLICHLLLRLWTSFFNFATPDSLSEAIW